MRCVLLPEDDDEAGSDTVAEAEGSAMAAAVAAVSSARPQFLPGYGLVLTAIVPGCEEPVCVFR